MVLGFWIHSNNCYINNSNCEYLLNNNNITTNKLIENGVCFHFTSLTLKNLIETKLKNRYYNVNNPEGNYRSYLKNFNKCSNYFKIIEINILSKYIDDKDIMLIRE